MYSFLSDGAEYLSPAVERLGNTTLREIPGNLVSSGTTKLSQMNPLQREMGKDVGKLAGLIPGVGTKGAYNVARFAGRAMPLLSAISNVTDVADIIGGDESFANKAMDATAMGTGAVIGGVLGGGVFSPLTASIGASVGKMASDGTQWLFGDKKTPEQRKMELALAELQGGMY